MEQSGGMTSKYEDGNSKIKKTFNKGLEMFTPLAPGEEGERTRAVEKQTSRIPSIAFLGLALAAMGISAGFSATKKNKGLGNFIGLWVPSILVLGLYNKIVKTHGSDAKRAL